MKNSFVFLLVAVVIILSTGTTYFFKSGQIVTTTERTTTSFTLIFTSTETKTIALGGTTQHANSTQEIMCTSSGPAIGVLLRVVEVNNTGITPVAVPGARISGEDVWHCNNTRQVITFSPATTNSSGWVNLAYGGNEIYYVNVTYPGTTIAYSLSIPTEPISQTLAVFNISTGNLTTHFCEYNLDCTRYV
jgi:hypothetical protein